MFCDESWYDDIDKICKAVKLNFMRSMNCMLPHAKRTLIFALALLEVFLCPHWIIAGMLALVKMHLFSPITTFAHFTVLAVYTGGYYSILALVFYAHPYIVPFIIVGNVLAQIGHIHGTIHGHHMTITVDL